MRLLYLLTTIYIGLTLSGCSTTNTNKTLVSPTRASNSTTQHADVKTTTASLKNPLTVTFFTQGKDPNDPYIVLGTETVSKYNVVGIKRQEASIHDAMRTLAASIGGDAVINIKRFDNSITGTVIAYDKKSPQATKLS